LAFLFASVGIFLIYYAAKLFNKVIARHNNAFKKVIARHNQ
jgi:hypothetical protein